MPGPARCGTPSGWGRHKRNGEKPCDACATAKAAADKRWRAAPERRRRDRLSASAQRIALATLKDRYLDEYKQLYRSECERLFAEQDMTYTSRYLGEKN